MVVSKASLKIKRIKVFDPVVHMRISNNMFLLLHLSSPSYVVSLTMNKVSEEADALKVTTQNTQQSTHCVPPGTPLEVHKVEDLFGEQGSRDHYLSRRIETLKNKEQPIKLSQQIYISTGTQLRTVWNTTLFNFREKRNNLWTRQALCIEHWKGLNRH